MIRLNKAQFYFHLFFNYFYWMPKHIKKMIQTRFKSQDKLSILFQILSNLNQRILLLPLNLQKTEISHFPLLLTHHLYLSLSHGEYTSMYVKPGDNIELSLNTDEFDESINYKGSEASNFLAKKYLIQEQFNFYSKNFYLGSIEEYNLALSEYKSSIFQYGNSISDTAFINHSIMK